MPGASVKVKNSLISKKELCTKIEHLVENTGSNKEIWKHTEIRIIEK